MKIVRWAVAVAVVLALAVPAGALSLGGYSGPIKMKFSDLDTGTLYNVADGTYVGEATLDALPQVVVPSRFGNEDSWGITRLSVIEDGVGNQLWSRSTANTEIVAIFWGEVDTYLSQTTTGPNVVQDIHGVGMKIAFWEVPGNQSITLPGTFTTADRTAEDLVTGLNTGGTLLWTLNSVPGFNSLFPTDEFFTTFSPTGSAFGPFNAQGGMLADLGTITLSDGITQLTGAQNDMFASTPGEADWRITFTGVVPNAGNTGFLVLSDDPILANVVIPEPLTMIGMLLGAGTVVRYVRKRRQA